MSSFFSDRVRVGLLAAVLAVQATAVHAQQPPVYTVAKVVVNTQASDAVAAKEKATTQGSQRALRQLFTRLVAFKAHDRLPELSDSAVDGLVDGFVVREERFSSTRYIAKLDFTFEAAKVRDLLDRIGLPYTQQQAPPVTLLPMAQGEDVSQAWQAAWSALDLKHALTPLQLSSAQAGASLPAGMDATSQSIETLKQRLGTPFVVLASASVDQAEGRLGINLRGEDSIGRFTFSQSFRVYDGDVDGAAARAAEIARMALEARWRLTSLKSQGALEGPAPLETFTLTAAFDSLKGWRRMRETITGISGAQDVEVKSLFAGGAEVVLSFPGGPERFAKAAGAQGLTLNESRGEWILRQR